MEQKHVLDLEKAKHYARIWRKEEGGYNEHHKLHAFLIPKDDLTQVLAEGVDAVRAYIGVDDTDPNNLVEKLMIVGAKYDAAKDVYVDMLPGRVPEGGDVYDFTRPCPPSCDVYSPLN
jgi:hypothetical protein